MKSAVQTEIPRWYNLVQGNFCHKQDNNRSFISGDFVKQTKKYQGKVKNKTVISHFAEILEPAQIIWERNDPPQNTKWVRKKNNNNTEFRKIICLRRFEVSVERI